MRLRSFTVTLLLMGMAGLALTCKPTGSGGSTDLTITGTTATTTAGNLRKVKVTIRTWGLAHLVDDDTDPAKRRLLVVPNHKGFFGLNHDLLLLVETTFKSELLTRTGIRRARGMITNYAYDDFPSGYEIDLEASGLILPASPTLALTETGDATSADCPTTTVDRSSLHWLPRLSHVSKATFTAKSSHKAKDPLPRDVLARIDITHGTLVAANVGNRLWEFDRDGQPGGGDHVQVVADALDYKFEAMINPAKPFILKGRKFKKKSSDADQWLELVRVEPNSAGAVHIELANVVEKNFFDPKPTGTIPHFAHYYDVVENPKKVKRVFYTNQTCPLTSPNDSAIECGPTRVP